MTSLAEVYEGTVGEGADLRRLYLGVGLFLTGSLLAVAGIVVAGTQASTNALGLATARQYGGILAGVGVPAVFLGVFTVLPAGRVTRAAAVVGAGVSLLGVSLFTHAYPCRWSGANCAGEFANLTLPTAGVYFLGVITTFWCLFVGVANFKSRNNPGGTVELEVTRGGETKVIEVSKSKLDTDDAAAGGIGFFGDTPDGEVDTQTNRRDGAPTATVADSPGEVSDGGASTEQITGLTDADEPSGPTTPNSPNRPGSPGGIGSDGSDTRAGATTGNGTTTDGNGTTTGSGTTVGGSTGTGAGGPSFQTGSATGSSSADSSSGGSSRTDSPSGPSASDEAATGSPGDSYCGSCAHFQYVRTDDGMQPYCGHHDELMDDMDACEEWTPR